MSDAATAPAATPASPSGVATTARPAVRRPLGRRPRVAVVGAGGIGTEHLRCLAAGGAGELVAVCDASRAAARAAAEEAGGAEVFTDLTALLAAGGVDAVHLTTPPASHVPLAREALLAGVHVLVEKPLAATPAEVAELVRLAEERGLLLLEDYNYLLNDQVRTMLRWRDEGRLGDVVHVDVAVALDVLGGGGPLVSGTAPHFALGLRGGLVSDFLPHLAALAHAFVGAADEVHAVWRKRLPSRLAADELRVLVAAERGTATLAFSASAQPDVFALAVEGTRMRARADLYGTGVVRHELLSVPGPLVPLLNGVSGGGREAAGAVGGLLRKLSGGPGAYEGLWALVAAFHAALRDGTPPPVTPRDVLEVNDLVARVEAVAP